VNTKERLKWFFYVVEFKESLSLETHFESVIINKKNLVYVIFKKEKAIIKGWQ
jgi:hypothetical protein